MAGDFSDEEWDISDDQLQVLEHNAIISTQPQQARSDSVSKSNFSRNTNIHSGSTVRLDTPTVQKAAAATRPPQSAYQQRKDDSFDSAVLDEDGVPLIVEEQKPQRYARPGKTDETTQREQWRQDRYASKDGQPSHRPPAKAIPHQAYQTYQRQNGMHGRLVQRKQAPMGPKTPIGTQLTPSSQPVAQQPLPPPDQSATYTELARERREKELLQQKLNSLTTELQTAKGENAVIRSKVANDAKLAERQLNAAKRQLQEQATKHQTELHSRDAAYSELTTHHNFVKHELDEQARKVNSLQRQAVQKLAQDGPNVANLSPRKTLRNTLRDGFDDDEIMQLSPARSPAKRKPSKPTTPTKKRKQPGNPPEGPTLALRFSQPQNGDGELGKEEEQAQSALSTRFIRDHRTEEHLQLLQAVLVFQPPGAQDTLVENLVNFQFPSDPHRSLSSMLLFETSKLKGDRLPGELLTIFSHLLSRCVKEEYYKPSAALLSSVELILNLNPTIVDAEVIQTMLRPLQALATVNPRKRWNLEKNKVWDESKPKPKLDANVDSSACLNLLFFIASLVMDEPELIRLFWRCMDTEFVLLMLTPIQTISDLQLMLELLSTSVQADTFGNICNPEEQSRMETYIVDKICFLLWDPPRHIVKFHPRRPYSTNTVAYERKPRRSRKPNNIDTSSDPAPTRSEICNLRLQVVSLLSSLLTSQTPHPHPHPHPSTPQTVHRGTSIFLSHPTAIARLIRCLYDEVSLLSSSLPTQPLHAKLVNTITTVVHHILLSPSATNPQGSFELQSVLSGTSIGVHKFRVVMTRIAFCEDKNVDGVDNGVISEESARKATEVLEAYVTPDEAVQLVEVLGRVEGEGDDTEGNEKDRDRLENEDEEAERAEADVMAGVEH